MIYEIFGVLLFVIFNCSILWK